LPFILASRPFETARESGRIGNENGIAGPASEIAEVVLNAALDVDSVSALIDAEIEQIRSIPSTCSRDRVQNIINIPSIVTGGAFGAVTSSKRISTSPFLTVKVELM